MAHIIPDQILDAALDEIVKFSDGEARVEIDRISIMQPAQAEYSMTMIQDSEGDVQSFALGVFIALHTVFEKQFGPLQKVGTKSVEQIADRNEQAMIYLRIRQPDEEVFSAALANSVRQPSLLAYVSASIFTPEENVPGLSEFQQGCLWTSGSS